MKTAQQDEIQSVLTKSYELIMIGRGREAMQLLLPALRNNPDDDRLHIQISEAYLAINQVKEALLHADLSIKACPTREEGYLLRSRIFQKQGQKRRALEEADNALRLAPQSSSVAIRRFNSLMNLGWTADARKVAVIVRPRIADSVTVHEMFGRLALAERKPEEAEKHFRQLLAVDPEAIYAKINLATSLMRQGRDKEAFDLVLSTARIAPTDEDAKHNLVISVNRLLAQGPAQYWIWLNVLPPVLRVIFDVLGISISLNYVLGTMAMLGGLGLVSVFRKARLKHLPQSIRDFVDKQNKEIKQSHLLRAGLGSSMKPLAHWLPWIFWIYIFATTCRIVDRTIDPFGLFPMFDGGTMTVHIVLGFLVAYPTIVIGLGRQQK